MVDCSGPRAWIPFMLGCLLNFVGCMYLTPRKMPVLFWMSVFAPVAVPVCIFGTLYLIEKLRRHRDGNRNEAVAAVQEQTLEPELREPPNADGTHSFHIASLPMYICDKEAVEGGPVCPICTELFGNKDVMIQLPLCLHSFHKECLEVWLQRNLTCPVCRCRVDMEIPRDIALIID